VSGASGFSLALPHLPKIDVAIVGEPTGMQPAIAEKGLMVLDVTAHGQSGHAARQEGVNAIYEALDDLNWLHGYRFESVSPVLGPTLMNVTVIHAGTQHNVVPDRCEMTVDVRTNELYTNDEVLAFIQSQLHSEVKARSTRLQPSRIDPAHPLVRRCVEVGMTPFGSPTLSDQALMPFPSMKLGPGQSSRSHSADEYILVSEIAHAIEVYIDLLTAR
jgi:acetylornithine deacetylase